jgi:transposase
MVVLIGPGHAHDSPMFDPLMGQLRVPRVGPGRPRNRPEAVLGDKVYSSRAHRARLRARGICAVIPEQSKQADNRRRRGSRGGRPVGFDAQKYKRRNVIERSFNTAKNWRGLATRYDKLALTYRAAAVLAAICAWLRHLRDTP